MESFHYEKSTKTLTLPSSIFLQFVKITNKKNENSLTFRENGRWRWDFEVILGIHSQNSSEHL